MNFPPGFLEIGFVSDDVTEIVPDIRAANAAWFALADDTNAALMEAANHGQTNVRENLWAVGSIAVRILMRTCGAMQALIILAERGMLTESRTMARNILENSICIAALHDESEKFTKILQDDSNASQQRQRNFILAQKMIKDENKEENLKKIIEEVGRVGSMNLKEIAAMGPFSEYYLYYQRVSDDASHLTARSLNKYVSRDKKTNAFSYLWKISSTEETSSTLHSAIMSALAVGIAFTQITKDAERNEKFGILVSRFEEMPNVQFI